MREYIKSAICVYRTFKVTVQVWGLGYTMSLSTTNKQQRNEQRGPEGSEDSADRCFKAWNDLLHANMGKKTQCLNVLETPL